MLELKLQKETLQRHHSTSLIIVQCLNWNLTATALLLRGSTTYNRTMLELKYRCSRRDLYSYSLIIVQCLNWNFRSSFRSRLDSWLIIVQCLNWNLALSFGCSFLFRLIIVQCLNWNNPAYIGVVNARRSYNRTMLELKFLNRCPEIGSRRLIIVQCLNWNTFPTEKRDTGQSL